MADPIRVTAQRLTPEEAEAARAAPTRTVRATEVGPPTLATVQRARWRGMLIGASLAAGAGVATLVGWLFVARRRGRRSDA